MDLPDASLDVVLTPHVLEHVPDTGKALAEVRRVLRRRGAAFVQVPLLQPVTAPPVEPEYHQDNTLVHWRFGADLTDMMRDAGFKVSVLVTEDLARRVATSNKHWPEVSAEFDAAGIIEAFDSRDLAVVANDAESRQMGFEPSYMFVTWECRKR